MIAQIRKLVNPPYSVIDIFTIIGLIAVLITIPVISLNVSEVREPTSEAAGKSSPCGNYGDVDNDGDVDPVDGNHIQNHVLGKNTSYTPFNADQLKRADVNGDGQVTVGDAQRILRFDGGLDITLPICADNDQDTYSNPLEEYLGTDPFDQCPDNTSDDALPADFNRDKKVNFQDIYAYSGKIGLREGQSGFDKRLDLFRDGVIVLDNNNREISDPHGIMPWFNKTCSNSGSAPTLTFKGDNASAFSIDVGESVRFTWAAGNSVAPCWASGGSNGWGGLVQTSGEKTIKITSTGQKIFKMTCGGPNGKVEREVGVTVKAPACEGVPNSSSTNPNPVSPGGQISITGSGLSNCSSADTLNWNVWDWSQNKYIVLRTCNLSNGSSCTTTFNAPTRTDTYPMLFFLKKADGSRVYGNPQFVDMRVGAACSGKPNISLSTDHIQTNSGVRATGTGVSNCSGSDRLKLQAWSWDKNTWEQVTSCGLTNGTSCYVEFSFSTARSYPLRFVLDRGNNGSIEEYGDWVFLYVEEPVSYSPDCNGKYTTHGGGGSYYTPNLSSTGNFGDPNCDYSINGLYNILWSMDSAHADFFFHTIAPCESGYNPNATFFGAPDPAGAWGLFQMGRGRNGQYDHGDVIWSQQASNAINYHFLLGHGYAYWQCAYH